VYGYREDEGLVETKALAWRDPAPRRVVLEVSREYLLLDTLRV
jgi:hypothetical protein